MTAASFIDTELSPIRKIIGGRMDAGWAVPKVSITVEAQTDELSTALVALSLRHSPVKTTLFDAILLAVARSLRAHPAMNSALFEGKQRTFEAINLGFAVNLPQGLFVPVIKDADRMSVVDIAKERAALTARVRDGDFSSKVLGNGTFTLSNLGGFGVDFFSPILNVPQCGILGVGTEKLRPVVSDGQVVARRTTYLTLVFDHRLVDGAPAAAFLRDITQQLVALTAEIGA
ncbi:MAG TPA: 2-oxo acid dehydrogenase subunit E2 [Steroidobacter sp.]|uniref:2-oxo acid dehydrogenase subunit E2 n=1 Tax=Steroidobacter sp. TaxID=1978227 RepID=UPI002ED8999C